MADAVRGPLVDVVPLIFAQLSIQGATVESLAATYQLDPAEVERMVTAAERQGYVTRANGVFSLTTVGADLATIRGEPTGPDDSSLWIFG